MSNIIPMNYDDRSFPLQQIAGSMPQLLQSITASFKGLAKD